MPMKKCLKHVRYKGKGIPKHECTSCLELYVLVSAKPRFGIQAGKVFKSKKSYSRREQKHNNKKHEE
jgi:hypothetical protein